MQCIQEIIGDVERDNENAIKTGTISTGSNQSNMSHQKHHKIRSCPLKDCDYSGGDLKRHLGSKKHEDEVDPKLIDYLVQVADKGSNRRGSNRLLFRWCPMTDCSFLTCHLRKHLKTTHGIKNSVKLDNLRKGAIPYEPHKLPSIEKVPPELDTESDSENDDEDYVPLNARSFFQTQRIASVRHRFLVDFYNYLGTVDEGQKAENVRFQHAYQMRKILEGIDPDGKDIEALAGEGGRAVWNLWVSPRLENKSAAAGTLLSYLNSYNKFLKFVVKRQRRRQPNDDDLRLSEETCEILSDTIGVFSGWRATILKHLSVERNEYYLKECERRLTREDLRAFLQSSVITKAESLFLPGSKCDGVYQFTRARDYLITRLAVSCGSRPRPLETATIEHFNRARRDSEFANCFVMLVPKHKRQMDGPAMVTMDERLHKFIGIYIRDFRSTVVASQKERHLFVNIGGQPFKRGTIGARVTALWEHSGVRQDLRVSCTDFRKCIVTAAEQSNKEQRTKTGRSCIEDSDLRKLLCHTQETAALWYMRENLTAVGARAHTALERILEGGSNEITPSASDEPESATELDPPDENDGNETDTNHEEPAMMDTDPPAPPRTLRSTLRTIRPAPANSSPVAVDVLRAPPRIRREWSSEDTALFLRFVKSFKGVCPGKRTIYDEFNASPVLKNILQREGMSRCVLKAQTTFKALRRKGQL